MDLPVYGFKSTNEKVNLNESYYNEIEFYFRLENLDIQKYCFIVKVGKHIIKNTVSIADEIVYLQEITPDNIIDIFENSVYAELLKKNIYGVVKFIINQKTEYFETFKYICKKYYVKPHGLLYYAAQNGHLKIAKHLNHLNSIIPISGDPEVDLLCQRNKGLNIFRENYDAIEIASSHGHLKVVKYLLNYIKKMDITLTLNTAISYASRNNHLEVVKFLYNNHVKHNSLQDACFVDNLEVVEYLYENLIEDVQKNAMEWAKIGGSVLSVEFLRQKNIDVDISDDDVLYAIKNGHLELIKYFHKNGMDFSKNADFIKSAIKYNKMHIIEYLYQNGAYIDFKDENLIKKLIKRSYADNINDLYEAKIFNNIDFIEYLHENGNFTNVQNENFVKFALSYEDISTEVIRYFIENCKFTKSQIENFIVNLNESNNAEFSEYLTRFL